MMPACVRASPSSSVLIKSENSSTAPDKGSSRAGNTYSATLTSFLTAAPFSSAVYSAERRDTQTARPDTVSDMATE